MVTTNPPPPLRMPGATLITRLKVYDTPAPDGQRGGTPHVHLLCSEMYIVLAGSGAVEIINQNGCSHVDLHPYSALVFSPGTIHRLINPHGDLELLVIMQHSGLPERGDNIVTLPPTWLADAARYAEVMHVESLEDAYRRRDLGVTGFLQLKAQFEDSEQAGHNALSEFLRLANARTAPQHDAWAEIITTGAGAETKMARQQLNALDAGQIDHLLQAQHHLIPAGNYNKLGFCGHLRRYFDPATLRLEGIEQP